MIEILQYLKDPKLREFMVCSLLWVVRAGPTVTQSQNSRPAFHPGRQIRRSTGATACGIGQPRSCRSLQKPCPDLQIQVVCSNSSLIHGRRSLVLSSAILALEVTFMLSVWESTCEIDQTFTIKKVLNTRQKSSTKLSSLRSLIKVLGDGPPAESEILAPMKYVCASACTSACTYIYIYIYVYIYMCYIYIYIYIYACMYVAPTHQLNCRSHW